MTENKATQAGAGAEARAGFDRATDELRLSSR